MENDFTQTPEEVNPINESNNEPKVSIQEVKTEKKCTNSVIFTKVNFYVNILLFLVLLAVLLYHPFKSTDKQNTSFPDNGSMKIAFLNTDTIFNNYQMVKDLQEDLNSKKSKLENEVMAKQQAFQTKLTNYQSNVQNNRITYDQAQNAEKKLMQERDGIVALGERYSNDLAALEFQIHQQITDSIINYTTRFNQKFQADYILGYTKGGGILVANPKFEVTMEILNGLNEEYDKTKKTNK